MESKNGFFSGFKTGLLCFAIDVLVFWLSMGALSIIKYLSGGGSGGISKYFESGNALSFLLLGLISGAAVWLPLSIVTGVISKMRGKKNAVIFAAIFAIIFLLVMGISTGSVIWSVIRAGA